MSDETEIVTQLETIDLRLRALRQRVASMGPKPRAIGDVKALEKQIGELRNQSLTLRGRLNPKPRLVARY